MLSADCDGNADQQRFDTDSAAEEKRCRDLHLHNYHTSLDHKRCVTLKSVLITIRSMTRSCLCRSTNKLLAQQREQQKDAEQKAEEQRASYLRDHSLKGKRNGGRYGEPHDLTLRR